MTADRLDVEGMLTLRLRAVVPYQGRSAVAFLCHEAADEIDRLLAERRGLVEALKDAQLLRCPDEDPVAYQRLVNAAMAENDWLLRLERLGDAITHADACRLSVLFGRASDLRTAQDLRINEWLKTVLAALAEPPSPVGQRDQGVMASRDLTHAGGVKLEGAHPEALCQDCAGPNRVWFAPSPLWNLVMGGPEAKGDPGGIVCPMCFIRRAEEAGIVPTAWVVAPEAAPIANETGSPTEGGK